MVPEDGAQQAAAATAEHPAVSEVDSFRRQVDDLASKTDVVTPPPPSRGISFRLASVVISMKGSAAREA